MLLGIQLNLLSNILIDKLIQDTYKINKLSKFCFNWFGTSKSTKNFYIIFTLTKELQWMEFEVKEKFYPNRFYNQLKVKRMRRYPVMAGWLIDGVKADCLTKDLGLCGVPSVGVFLRDPSPYLCEFRIILMKQ